MRYVRKLHVGLWEHGIDGLQESLQSVHAGDKDVLHTPVPHLGHHLQPELGSFGLCNPGAQQLLLAGHADAQRQMDHLGANAAGTPHLYMDEPDKRWDTAQLAGGTSTP